MFRPHPGRERTVTTHDQDVAWIGAFGDRPDHEVVFLLGQADPSPNAPRGRSSRRAARGDDRVDEHPLEPRGDVVTSDRLAFVTGRRHRHELRVDALGLEQEANLAGLRERQIRPTGPDPKRGHRSSSGSSPKSSASSLACPRSVPGSFRSFIATIRIVQELGRHAARDRLDRVALDRRELGEPGSPSIDLRADHPVAALAERLDHRRELVAAATDDPSTDLVVDDRAGARDLLGRLRRVVTDPVAQGEDVDHPNPVELRGLRLDVARHGQIQDHQRPTGAAGRRPPQVGPTDHVAGRAGRRDDQVGVLEGTGEPIQPAVVGIRSFGQGARVLQGAVEHPDRTDLAAPEVTDGELGHPAGADHDRPPPGDPAQRFVRQIRSDRDIRVGRAPSAVSWRTRRPARTAAWNTVASVGPAASSASARRRASRTWRWICVSPRHHRVQTRRDREQVVGRVALPVRVQRVGELLVFDASRLDEHTLEREEAGVVARDVPVGLDAVAGRQDHDLRRVRRGRARADRPSSGRRHRRPAARAARRAHGGTRHRGRGSPRPVW